MSQQEYSEASLDTQGAAAHFAAKMAYTTGPTELQRAIDNDEVVVVDVRLAEHYAEGHIPKSISLPYDKWGTREGLSREKPNVLVCYHLACHLAAKAALEFSGDGYPVMELEGGMKFWRDVGMPEEQS